MTAARSPWPWRPFAAFGVFGLFWGAWGASLPAIKVQTGASDAQIGLALLALAAAALPAMLSSGWIIDRLGDASLAPMTAAFGLAAALPGLARSPLWLGASLLAVGATSGALDVTMNAVVAGDEGRSGRRLMHAAHATFSAGVVVASVSVGLARSGGAGPAIILGVVAALVLGVALLVLVSGLGDVRLTERAAAPSRGALMLQTPLLILGGLCALAYLVENALQSWSALHLEETLGGDPLIGGLGPAFFAGAAGLGRLGAQGLSASLSDRQLLIVAALVGTVGTIVTALAPSTIIALGGVFLAGAGISIAAPTIFSLTGRLAPGEHRGRAMSTVTATAYLGFLLGPPMVGAVAGALDLRAAFLTVAGAAVLLGALTPLAPRSVGALRTGRASG
ncbi:MAG TPA: MFS transporter [Actinomycetota bacterium]